MEDINLKILKVLFDQVDENLQILGNEVIDISGMSKEEIKNMVDNCTRQLNYNPEKMWFDYQALFDKTRNKILGKSDNIKVRHIDFDKNDKARKAVFGSEEVDVNFLNRILDGDLGSQAYVTNQLYYLYRDDNDDDMYTNFCFFLAIKIALGSRAECNWIDYSECSWDDFVPTYFTESALKNKNNELIEKMNFYAIVRPILGSMHFNRNFY